MNPTIRRLGRLLSSLGLVLAVGCTRAYGQIDYQTTSEAPILSMQPTQSQFELFDPVLVVLTMSNPTPLKQAYGNPGLLNTNLAWTLTEPSGQDARQHLIYYTLRTPHFPRTFAPFEISAGTVSVSINWPTWREMGQYEIRVVYNDGRYTSSANASFTVVPIPGADSSLVEQLSFAATNVFDKNAALRDTVGAAISNVLSEPAVSQGMKDFAGYLNVLYDRLVFDDDCISESSAWRCTSTRRDSIVTEFASFADAHEGTHWGDLTAGKGYLLRYKGERVRTDTLAPVFARVFLEGTFSGGQLRETLWHAGDVPVPQPYDSAPWSFPEVRRLMATRDCVDWVLISLLSPAGELLTREVGLVDSLGYVHADVYKLSYSGSLVRLIIDHRNHVAVASDTLLRMDRPWIHDFTTGHAFGSNSEKRVITGDDTTYVMWAGDANADGAVDETDLDVWRATRDTTGYVAADFNLDGAVTTADSTIWAENAMRGARTGVPERIWEVLFDR